MTPHFKSQKNSACNSRGLHKIRSPPYLIPQQLLPSQEGTLYFHNCLPTWSHVQCNQEHVKDDKHDARSVPPVCGISTANSNSHRQSSAKTCSLTKRPTLAAAHWHAAKTSPGYTQMNLAAVLAHSSTGAASH